MGVRRGGRKRTFDRRIVFVDEVALDQLDGQAGLSDTSATDDDELVLSQELELSARVWMIDDVDESSVVGVSYL